MAYRRKIIDRRTREGKALGRQLDTLKGVVVLVVVVASLIYGAFRSDGTKVDAVRSDGVALDRALPPQQAMAGVDASVKRLSSGANASGMRTLDAAPVTVSPSSGSPAISGLAGPVPGAESGRQLVPWRHVTATGVRWSLRRTGPAARSLLVDLGGDQVANVAVDPAFENLDLPGMNARVDFIRSVISQRFALRTANYTFDRDGTVRQVP